jgi:hypothetical protein
MRGALLVAWLIVFTLVGCAPQPALPINGPPPLRVSYRKSKVPAQGMVVGLNNPTDQKITVVAVFIRGKRDKEERSYRLDNEIEPLDTISFGWMDFHGWKLQPGDKLRFVCAEYNGDFECQVPD